MDLTKGILQRGHKKAQETNSRVERLFCIAMGVNHIIQPKESLDALAHAAELPEQVWGESVQIIESTDDPQQIEKERQRLNNRVERFLLHGEPHGG